MENTDNIYNILTIHTSNIHYLHWHQFFSYFQSSFQEGKIVEAQVRGSVYIITQPCNSIMLLECMHVS